jgi:hypothetical protein
MSEKENVIEDGERKLKAIAELIKKLKEIKEEGYNVFGTHYKKQQWFDKISQVELYLEEEFKEIANNIMRAKYLD